MRPWWKSSSRPTIGAEARSDSAGFLDLDPGRGELVDFPFVMGDIKNRQAQIVADAADHFHDLAAAGGVKRRQRLVHQQKERTRQQRPPTCDTFNSDKRRVGKGCVQQGSTGGWAV